MAKKTTKKSAKKSAKKAAKKKVINTTLQNPDKLPSLVFKPKVTGKKDKEKQLTTMTTNIRKSIDLIANRSKTKPLRLHTPAGWQKLLMPPPSLQWQYAISSIGFRVPSCWEIVAPDGVGKTTLAVSLAGYYTEMGCYSAIMECEGKPMSITRMQRIVHPDRKKAAKIVNSIMLSSARTLHQCDHTLKQVVKDLRKRCDDDPTTKGNPIFVFIDPWSGLMSADEAKGNSDWGLSAQAKAKPQQAKDTATGSNFGHSKHAQGMKRWLPNFLETYNAVAVFINHQNDKVDMSGMPMFIKPSESKNDTRIGGRAFRQLCPYRMTLMPMGELREKSGDKRVYGHHVKGMVIKNSYGAKHRTFEFTIYSDLFNDNPTTTSPRISFAPRSAVWMAKMGLLGTTMSDERFTCDALDCVNVGAEELMAALEANPEQKDFIGAALKIEGYSQDALVADDPVEDDDDDEGPATSDPAAGDEIPPVVPAVDDEKGDGNAT